MFLEAHRITRRHGARTVLDGVDLRVGAASRIALIGPNGSGKSTLLRILAGLERPDGGRVRRNGTVGYLPQLAGGERTVRETILERIGVAAAARDVDRLEARLAGGDLDAVEPHAAALDRWLALGGADAEARLGAATAEVGLDSALLDRPLATLSGGQASRAGLAALRTSRFDVVLLDEPTNHLDDDGLARLATLLGEHRGGAVLVSHDRALLAEVADELVELDARTGAATPYGGGWDAYEHEREARRAAALAAHEDALARRSKLVDAEREARRRAASARSRVRGDSEPDKNVREWVRSRADGVAGRAAVISRRAERVEVPDKPWEDRPLRLHLTAAERRGAWVVALDGAILARGRWRLGPIDLALAHGDRLLLRGRNGSGKSTLLAALAGTLPLAAGTRKTSSSAVVAQLGQARDALAGNGPLSGAVRALTGLDEAGARAALASFGLGAEAADRPATSPRSRCSRRRCRAGRARSSSPRTTAGCATPSGSLGSWHCDHMRPALRARMRNEPGRVPSRDE